ncbi:DUF6055 domain-containing protein [Pedobacter sp. Leaf132]|uniref:DUF6055 domain-containing protein n=1 Tax=Pedobacter sp. Leaf132 TaxID=2876557 RepID=UPI001E40736C|nr:DUF6055 domain-containing protein [Pedobacter sp. Leaf132]
MKPKLLLILLLQLSIHAFANPKPGKEVYLPNKISTVPKNNDFADNNSEYSNKRSAESENFKIYWSKEYGDNPLVNEVQNKRFDIKHSINELERFYNYYVDELKLVKKGSSISDKYKILVFITGGKTSTAYGGGEEKKVGILWCPAVRLNPQPYGVLAHELGHVFQFLARCDNGDVSYDGPINEMGAQYVLWQVYPEWLTFENFHLKAFLNNTYHAFLHPENAYHSPFVLEYWAEKHGKEFYGKLLQEVRKGEDPVLTYKRVNHLNQEQFNKEIFDASGKFITWDIKRVKSVAAKYINQHHSKVDSTQDGWLKITKAEIPEDYGYNAIKLRVPDKDQSVSIQFSGLIDSLNQFKTDKSRAGWRYGFVAYKKNGRRIYGDMNSDTNGKVYFKVPKNTKYLWLVVTGAPNDHLPIKRKDNHFNKYPYQFKLSGTGVL